VLPGARVLAIPEFRRFWIGQTASTFGDAIYFIAFLFVAEKLTGNAMVVGLVGALSAIPYVVFAPLAGVLADRLDRRKIMVIGDSVSTIVTLALGLYALFSPSVSVVAICLAAFSLSTVNAFFNPARTAAVPALVPREYLIEANALTMASSQVISMISLALSTLLLGAIDKFFPQLFLPVTAFLNCFTFAVSAGFIATLPALKPGRDETESEKPQGLAQKASEAFQTGLKDIKEGLRVLGHDPVMKIALLVNAAVSVSISGFMVVYVASNKLWFGGEFWRLGLIEFAFVFFMAVFSILAGRSLVKRPGPIYIYGTLALGLLVLLMVFGRNYWIFLILNALCGVALPYVWLTMNTYIQTAFKSHEIGRVSAAWLMVQQAAQPIGILLVGPSIEYLGLATTFAIMGAAIVLACLPGLLNRKFMLAPMVKESTSSENQLA
jgi:MFS family permease